MRLIDLNYDTVECLDHPITVLDIWIEWDTGRRVDPLNYDQSFLVYMSEIMMDTINGRNDLEFLNMTVREINDLTLKLLKIAREIVDRREENV